MGRFWQGTEKQVGRLSNWAGAFAGLTALDSWLASKLIWLKPYGWPEFVFAGLVIALGSMMVLGFVLIAIRYFRPLEAALPSRMQFSSGHVPPISTPELRQDLEQQIRSLEKSLSAKIGALTEVVSKLQYETTIDHPNASTVAEAFRNLDDAVEVKLIDEIFVRHQRIDGTRHFLHRLLYNGIILFIHFTCANA